MLQTENLKIYEFNHLKGVNKQPYWGHQNLSITFNQLMYLFLFSTAVPRSTLQWLACSRLSVNGAYRKCSRATCDVRRAGFGRERASSPFLLDPARPATAFLIVRTDLEPGTGYTMINSASLFIQIHIVHSSNRQRLANVWQIKLIVVVVVVVELSFASM